MSKLYNLYENDLDKVWYDSSNILYSECDDATNQLKTLRVTFKNGATYQYKDVAVNDYMMFRESLSTGKAFIKYIKKYDFDKLDNKDTEQLLEEYKTLTTEINNEQNQ